MTAKALQLISLLPRDPVEFIDRVRTIVEARISPRSPGRYHPDGSEQAMPLLQQALGLSLNAPSYKSELAELAEGIARRGRETPDGNTSGRDSNAFHNGDASMLRLLYVLIRAVRPATVLETGVCNGLTSVHILSAFERNQQGTLHSIDLPPLGKHDEPGPGALVPVHLRDRWCLHLGATRRVLPRLARKLGSIDLFVHDSLHTRSNMLMEFSCAWKVLRPGGVLLADDVEGNSAFAEWAERSDVKAALVLQQEKKSALFGVAVKSNGAGNASSGRP
jgi:predicted O-methyltransferase YrrM